MMRPRSAGLDFVEILQKPDIVRGVSGRQPTTFGERRHRIDAHSIALLPTIGTSGLEQENPEWKESQLPANGHDLIVWLASRLID